MKKTPLQRISAKRAKQSREEKLLIGRLIIRSGGLCEECKSKADWRGLSKHEIKSRAQGGDPLDPANCVMLCGRNHSKEHHIYEEGGE